MSIGWAPDMIGWACAQPFPTLATPLNLGSFFINLVYVSFTTHPTISLYTHLSDFSADPELILKSHTLYFDKRWIPHMNII